MNRTYSEYQDSGEWVLLAQQGDCQALEQVTASHQRLITSLALRFHGEWFSREELVQAGYVGLLQALRAYDSSKQTKLSTYAVPWILGEMKNAFKRAGTAHCSLDETAAETGQSLYDLLAGPGAINLDRLDLQLALSRLTLEEQILISLRYFRGKTQKEAAVILKKSQAQISKTENRILCTLRAMLT